MSGREIAQRSSGKPSEATDCVKILKMCFDSAQHERFRIVISSTYPFALSASKGSERVFTSLVKTMGPRLVASCARRLF
jgi:hypothetical protein